MTSRRIALLTLAATATAALAACSMDAAPSGADGMVMGNAISGEGLPNPNPTRTASWGEFPAGRNLGSTAGADIDPTDGNVWMYERCGSGSAGGAGVNCDSNPVDPVFKFDRNTGALLANIGAGVMVTPHGIGVDEDGNVWVTDFAQNQARTKGHQFPQVQPSGRASHEPRHGGPGR